MSNTKIANLTTIGGVSLALVIANLLSLHKRHKPFTLNFQSSGKDNIKVNKPFACSVTIDVTPCKYKKSKKSDKILIEQKNIYRKDFLL